MLDGTTPAISWIEEIVMSRGWGSESGESSLGGRCNLAAVWRYVIALRRSPAEVCTNVSIVCELEGGCQGITPGSMDTCSCFAIYSILCLVLPSSSGLNLNFAHRLAKGSIILPVNPIVPILTS
jgi:hypothetical protein